MPPDDDLLDGDPRQWAPAAVSVLAAAGVVATTLERLLRHAGATPAEVAMPLPGDELVRGARIEQTRAVDIAAPPAAVWPWLVQIGWGRAGWYSLDLVERPIGAARSVAQDGTVSWRSLDHVAARHQDLAVGDLLPLGDGVGLTLVELEEARHLVGLLDHVVTDGRRLQWSWAVVLRPTPTGARLLARTRATSGGGALGAVLDTLLGAGHGVMETVQLRGIRDRVEASR